MYRKKTKTDVEKLLVGFEQIATRLINLEKQVHQQQITFTQIAHQITCLESTQEQIKTKLEYIKNL